MARIERLDGVARPEPPPEPPRTTTPELTPKPVSDSLPGADRAFAAGSLRLQDALPTQGGTSSTNDVPDRYQPRSTELLAGMSRLDTGLDPADCRDLAEWLREEYVTAYGDAPTGFLAPCRLGQPYVDHQLDLFHTTVDHYAPSDLVPEPLSSFRVLVRAGECAYVETYQGGLVLPVLHDGTVVQT